MSHQLNVIILTVIATALAAGAATAAPPPDVVASDASGNTAMGDSALRDLGIPNCVNGLSCYNTAAGAGSLYSNSVGSNNSGFGFQTLNSVTSGGDNSAMGYRALLKNQYGDFNSAFGSGALTVNTASFNSAFGYNALSKNTLGGANAAFGAGAAESNVSGTNNAAFGFYASQSNESGGFNAAFGDYALAYNQGSSNTGIGSSALLNGTGNQNTAIGANTLSYNMKGSSNIALGYAAGADIVGSHNIDIASSGSSSDNGVIRIGTSSTQTKTFISGIENSKITGNAVYVTSSGQLGVLASSERYKDRIQTMGDRSDRMQLLRPVTFHLKSDPKGNVQYGLIAEEVVKIYPELVIRDEAGKIQGVRYDELAPMLLNEMQKQRKQIAAQNDKIQAQDEKFAKLIKINEALLSAIANVDGRDQTLARAH
jgi:trimeric autotransporter adhesin